MINRYLGDMDPRECVVPPGAVVLRLKYCETCGNLFARRNRDRNCYRCHSNPVPLGLPAVVDLMKEECPLPQ
jgi:hypothetical protein